MSLFPSRTPCRTWCRTEPVTCDFDVIIATLPFSMVQPEPEYVLTSVTAGGSPLSGNYCPANSPDPFDSCPRGVCGV